MNDPEHWTDLDLVRPDRLDGAEFRETVPAGTRAALLALREQLRRPPCWGPNQNGDYMVDMEVDAYEADLDRLVSVALGEPQNYLTRTPRGQR